MAIKTEKLEKEIVETITSLQTKAAEQVHVLGEFHIRLRDLETEKKKIQEFVFSIEAEYDKLVTTLNETLKELEVKYPKGEIDLKEGVVIFDDGQ
jgi:predicted nuclease with TOPRIM domain